MAIKILLLKSGEHLIADVYDRKFDGRFSAYRLNNPRRIIAEQENLVLLSEEEDEKVESGKMNIILEPWCIFTKDAEIDVYPDWVVYLVDPLQDIKELYTNPNHEKDQVYFTEG